MSISVGTLIEILIEIETDGARLYRRDIVSGRYRRILPNFIAFRGGDIKRRGVNAVMFNAEAIKHTNILQSQDFIADTMVFDVKIFQQLIAFRVF